MPTPVLVPPADIWLGVRTEACKMTRVRAVLDCIAATISGRAEMLDQPYIAASFNRPPKHPARERQDAAQ